MWCKNADSVRRNLLLKHFTAASSPKLKLHFPYFIFYHHKFLQSTKYGEQAKHINLLFNTVNQTNWQTCEYIRSAELPQYLGMFISWYRISGGHKQIPILWNYQTICFYIFPIFPIEYWWTVRFITDERSILLAAPFIIRQVYGCRKYPNALQFLEEIYKNINSIFILS